MDDFSSPVTDSKAKEEENPEESLIKDGNVVPDQEITGFNWRGVQIDIGTTDQPDLHG